MNADLPFLRKSRVRRFFDRKWHTKPKLSHHATASLYNPQVSKLATFCYWFGYWIRMRETCELMPEISWKNSSPKFLDCRSEKSQLIWKFNTVFAEIFFSKRYSLQPKPYIYQSAHLLLSLDYEKREIFAQWWLDLEKGAHKWLIATVEAYFYLIITYNLNATYKTRINPMFSKLSVGIIK